MQLLLWQDILPDKYIFIIKEVDKIIGEGCRNAWFNRLMTLWLTERHYSIEHGAEKNPGLILIFYY